MPVTVRTNDSGSSLYKTAHIYFAFTDFALLLRNFPFSFLTTALYFFAETALFCIALELLIDHYEQVPLALSWSAIVLTVCGVIIVMLITVLSIRRLREEVQRRIHI